MYMKNYNVIVISFYDSQIKEIQRQKIIDSQKHVQHSSDFIFPNIFIGES